MKIPFARRSSDGRLIDIGSVSSNGKACGCVCPACGTPVIAKTFGKVKAPHFAHEAECSAAFETALHEAAKQVIRELGFVWLPDPRGTHRVRFTFTHHTLETRYDRVIPDVTVWRDADRKLAVEIFVTHAVDAEKLLKLRERRLACIEYDLSALPRMLTYDDLVSMFREGDVPARWIYNERMEPPVAADLETDDDDDDTDDIDPVYERQLLEAVHRQAAYRRYTVAGAATGIVYAVSCPLGIGALGSRGDDETCLTTADHCKQCRFAREAPALSEGRPSSVWCGGVAPQARELLRISSWQRDAVRG